MKHEHHVPVGTHVSPRGFLGTVLEEQELDHSEVDSARSVVCLRHQCSSFGRKSMPEVSDATETIVKVLSDEGYTVTHAQGRRYIKMGIVYLNGVLVDEPKATCKTGDLLTIRVRSSVRREVIVKLQ